MADVGMEEEQDNEIVLDFRVISPEATAKINKAIDELMDTKIREILRADEMYCKSRGWKLSN